ncbi:MAG: DUF2236 domain-containing protein, partial [Mycobacterium sp.]|nr:DUF2236 domain-containing protein [Mycobacterium sp.]
MLTQDTDVAHPRRFMAAQHRNRRLGRPLRLLTRTVRPDRQLIDTIGQRLMHRDEAGAALVAAMRIEEPGHPDRVSMGQFRQALHHGVASVP